MLEKENSHTVYLGLGSNLGDRGENLDCALNKIEERIGEIFSTSAFYVTEPMGFNSQNQFLNAVCEVKTKYHPQYILSVAKEIEREMGRERKSTGENYIDRIIDIDILLYDNDILETNELILPHPHLHERLFVLLPLAEIAGEKIHPQLHQSIKQLKDRIENNKKV